MKLLIGNGKKVSFRDVGDEPIYKMTVKDGYMLPCHGHMILSDEDAREFINNNKQFASCESLKGK